jgi:hypothetical protein
MLTTGDEDGVADGLFALDKAIVGDDAIGKVRAVGDGHLRPKDGTLYDGVSPDATAIPDDRFAADDGAFVYDRFGADGARGNQLGAFSDLRRRVNEHLRANFVQGAIVDGRPLLQCR